MQAKSTSAARVLPSVTPASIPLRRTLLARRAREVGCRFQPSRIDEITSTKNHNFSDQQSTRQGSVVLAWDGHRDAEKALKWTLNNLVSPGEAGETLDMVHVVCDPRGLLERTAVGSSPAGRLQMYDGLGARETSSSYQEYAERLLEGAHLSVQQRCADILHNCGVANQVHLPQLPCPRSASVIGQTLLREAERLGARMLVVASHGPGAMSEYGSVARYCYQHASMPLVLIPSADRTYFGTASFDAPGAASMDAPQAAMAPAMLQRREEGVSRGAPATQAHVKAHLDSAQDMPRGEHQHSQREVLLVVTNLHELEQHWQWVADNLCRQGDVLNIWHLHMAAPTSAAIQDCGYPSLPTALAQVLRGRGLADVKYSQHYFADENTTAEAAKKVVAAAEGDADVRMVCLLNYSRQGMVQEAVRGSVASELARHCPVPLVLLQPAT